MAAPGNTIRSTIAGARSGAKALVLEARDHPGGAATTEAPPRLTPSAAAAMISRLRFAEVLSGLRGSPPCDPAAIVSAIVCFSAPVSELGDALDAFDINPLICGPPGVVAVDALAVTRCP